MKTKSTDRDYVSDGYNRLGTNHVDSSPSDREAAARCPSEREYEVRNSINNGSCMTTTQDSVYCNAGGGSAERRSNDGRSLTAARNLTAGRSFAEKVRAYILEKDLLSEGEAVLVALSGGADSVALLLVLKALGYNLYAYHLNHGLRGADADADEAYCRALCDSNGIPFFSEKVDVSKFSSEEKISFEDAGRKIRYRGLLRIAGARGITKIATGHHMGDAAETFIMNAMRGAGLDGLCSIPYRSIRQAVGAEEPRKHWEHRVSHRVSGRRDTNSIEEYAVHPDDSDVQGAVGIVRPLLCVSREEIVRYLGSYGAEWREDSTNESDEYLRNRVRKVLDAAAVKKIGDCIALISRDRDYIDAAAREAFERHVRCFEGHASDFEERARCFEGHVCGTGCEAGAEAERGFFRKSGQLNQDGVEPGKSFLFYSPEILHPSLATRVVRNIVYLLAGSTVNLSSRHIDSALSLHNVGSKTEIGTGAGKVKVYRSYEGLEFSLSSGASASAVARAHTDAACDGWTYLEDERENRFGRVRMRYVGNNDESGNRECSVTSTGIGNIHGGNKIESGGDHSEIGDDNSAGIRPSGRRNLDKHRIMIDLNKVKGKLRIRSRKTGDEIIPFGMKGKKTIKKLLIDEKVDRRLREILPIVVDDEKIIWVAGVRMSESVRVGRGARAVLLELTDI